jgi:hypothetical protein
MYCCACGAKMALNAPKPTQDIHRKYRDSRSSGNTSQRLFCAGFAVREAVATDHNCDQTCNLRNGVGEKALDGVKAGIEGTSLGMGGEWGQDEK